MGGMSEASVLYAEIDSSCAVRRICTVHSGEQIGQQCQGVGARTSELWHKTCLGHVFARQKGTRRVPHTPGPRAHSSVEVRRAGTTHWNFAETHSVLCTSSMPCVDMRSTGEEAHIQSKSKEVRRRSSTGDRTHGEAATGATGVKFLEAGAELLLDG